MCLLWSLSKVCWWNCIWMVVYLPFITAPSTLASISLNVQYSSMSFLTLSLYYEHALLCILLVPTVVLCLLSNLVCLVCEDVFVVLIELLIRIMPLLSSFYVCFDFFMTTSQLCTCLGLVCIACKFHTSKLTASGGLWQCVSSWQSSSIGTSLAHVKSPMLLFICCYIFTVLVRLLLMNAVALSIVLSGTSSPTQFMPYFTPYL